MKTSINLLVLLIVMVNTRAICGNKTKAFQKTDLTNRVRIKRDFMEAAMGAAAMAADAIHQGAAFKDKGEGGVG